MNPTKENKAVKWLWRIVLYPIALIFIIILFVSLFAKIPSFEELEDPESNLATLLISEDGKTFSTFHLENRSYVKYEDLPLSLVHAAVATEDKRFYHHSGIDFRGLARVGFKTILMGDSSQGGGSTITQQLAKSLYPRENMNSKIPGVKYIKMVNTKVKEWITAVKLERNYTKNEILAMYLNTIFFGSNSYGIQAAANTFFGKEPNELLPEESACLLGMVNKPTRYNPVLNPEQSLKRRNYVLGQMQKARYITRKECDSLQQIPITLSFHQQDHNSGIGAYYDNSIAQPSYYINAKVAYKTEKSDISLEDYAQKITKTQISGGFICTQYGHTACSHWEMISGANCTTDGELKLECSVCGKTLEDEIIRAYGHHFTSWGECSTCGLSIEDYEEQLAASEEGMTGTVIGKTPVLILLITGGALVALMVVWLILKRKRRQKQ